MSKKILIIDDEELIVRSLKKLLEKNDFEVFLAKNGQDALVMTEEERFDLVIADIRLPGMNGVEAIQAIYNELEKNKQKRIPAIFISGYSTDNIKHAAKKLQPLDYVSKPFNNDELIDTIRKALCV